jgi:hypothetical protein
MKKIILLLAISVGVNHLMAQDIPKQKNDSVCRLVTKFLTEKNAGKLYDLTGEAFHRSLTPEKFKSVCDENLFPLGAVKECVLDNFSDNMATYKVSFDSLTLNLQLSLDSKDKIETFLLKP